MDGDSLTLAHHDREITINLIWLTSAVWNVESWERLEREKKKKDINIIPKII